MSTTQPIGGDPPDISDSLLRTFLTGHDAPCPQCNYNLRDLHGERCPECGEKLVLRVNLAEPKQGLLIAGLVGLSAGAGLNGLLLIYALIQEMRDPHDSSFLTRFVAINGVGFLIEGSALAFWLYSWRRIRRLSQPARISLMLACCGLTLVNIVVFSFLIK